MYRSKNRIFKYIVLQNQAKKQILLMIHDLVGQIQPKFNLKDGLIEILQILSMKLKLKLMKFLRIKNQNYQTFYLSSKINHNKSVK